MAKAATAATPPAQVQASQEENSDRPLIDSLGGAVKMMIAQGKEKGYVTYDDLNKALPPDHVSSEQIEDKFRTYAVSRISKDHAQNIIDAINDLENVSSTRDLIALLSAA